MTFNEATAKWRVSGDALRAALHNGLVPGARFVSNGRGRQWYIPDDASSPCPEKETCYGFSGPAYAFYDTSDPLHFVRMNANSQSIKWIAKTLGISTMDVREMYEQVLREDGGFIDVEPAQPLAVV